MKRRSIRRGIIRIAVLGLLLGSCFGPHVPVGKPAQAPIAVIDVSASTGGGVPAVPAGFDVEPKWIVVARGIQELFGGAETVRLARDGTHLGAALLRAAERAPGHDVLVCTDGRWTDAGALEAARAIARAGGRVFVCAPARPAADVGIVEARATGGARGLRVEVVLAASVTGEVSVALLEGVEALTRTTVAVTPGAPVRVVLRDARPATEARRLRVRIVPSVATPNDDRGNDTLVVGWRAAPRRIVLVGSADQGRALKNAGLGTQAGLDVDVVSELSEGVLATADVVGVLGAPWRQLARGATALERFVGQGGRLILSGGPAAWRAGGWQGRSTLERLSPLRVRDEPGEPARVLLVLDRSGSTAGAPLTHLRAAARSVLQGLPTDERLAGLPFGGESEDALLSPGWVARTDTEQARAWLEGLGELEARGKTDIEAALGLGQERLAAFTEAKRRLLVLLTDGDPDHGLKADSFASLARACDLAKIDRLALVVEDRDAWQALRDGFVSQPEDCLLLAGSERLEDRLRAALAARRFEQERVQHPEGFVPRGARVPPGFRPRSLHALVLHEQGEIVLLAEEPRAVAQPGGSVESWPLLARRQVGVGEVLAVAWGPGLEGPGSPATEPGLRLLGELLAQAAGEAQRGIEAAWVGSDIHLLAPEHAGAGTLPWLSAKNSGTMVEESPGLFVARVPVDAAETLRIVPAGAQAKPVLVPTRPGPEHRGVGIDDEALERLARAGEGARLAPGDKIPPPARGPGVPLAPWMLGLAALLLVIERAWRPRRELSDP